MIRNNENFGFWLKNEREALTQHYVKLHFDIEKLKHSLKWNGKYHQIKLMMYYKLDKFKLPRKIKLKAYYFVLAAARMNIFFLPCLKGRFSTKIRCFRHFFLSRIILIRILFLLSHYILRKSVVKSFLCNFNILILILIHSDNVTRMHFRFLLLLLSTFRFSSSALYHRAV